MRGLEIKGNEQASSLAIGVEANAEHVATGVAYSDWQIYL